MTVKPKSQYWALWMWSNLMGDQLIKSSLKGDDEVKTFVTQSEDSVQIMLVNTSETKHAFVEIDTKSIAGKVGQLHSYSSAQYFWDPYAQRPLWSRVPSTQPIQLEKKTVVDLPKFSINVLELPRVNTEIETTLSIESAEKPTLDLRLPSRVPADRPIEGLIVVHDPKQKLPYLQPIKPVMLSVQGPATLSHQMVKIDNAAATFTITPTGAGKITILATSGSISDSHEIELVALKERAHVHWTFDNSIPEWNVKSTFEIGSESSIKPNEYVAASRLHGETPGRDADLLFHFEPMPKDELPLKNASGIIGQLRAAHNLKCDDPKARVNIILQSDANHWMPIGSIRLSDMIGEWKSFAAKVSSPEQLDAMAKLYAIRFQIQSEAPVTGDLYLDDLGFIFRTGL